MKKKMSKKKTQRGGSWANLIAQRQEPSNQLCVLLKKIFKNEAINEKEYQTLFVDTKFKDFIQSVDREGDLFHNLGAISNLNDEQLREALFKR